MGIWDGAGGGLLAGGAGLAGGIIGNLMNAQQSRQQMDFQAQQSATSHRREVEDLTKAGLNPILSVNNGAQAMAGSQAQMQNPLSGAISSAMDATRLSKDLEGTDSQIGLNKANGVAANAAALRDTATAAESGMRKDVLKSQQQALKSSADLQNKQNELDSKTFMLRNVNSGIKSGAQTAKSILDLESPFPLITKHRNQTQGGHRYHLAYKGEKNAKIIKRDDGSIDVQEICEGKSLTQQQFKDDCDVNFIMKNYTQTGVVTHTNSRTGVYADFLEVPSYQEALEIVRYGDEAFMALDAKIRNKFDNNPQKMLDYLADPANIEESIKLGLRDKPNIEAPSNVVPPAPAQPPISKS